MINAYINGQQLKVESPIIVSDTVNYLELEAHFETDDWNEAESIYAMFDSGNTVYEMMLDGERKITKDRGLNLDSGVYKIYFIGKNDSVDNPIRITTTVESLVVVPSGLLDGVEFPSLTPTERDRLISMIGKLSDLSTEDKTNLVAAINEVYKKADNNAKDVSELNKSVSELAKDVSKIPKYSAGDGIEIDDEGKISNPSRIKNWNENNPESPEYIEGRTHYSEGTGNVRKYISKEKSVIAVTTGGAFPCEHLMEVGKTYIIETNGSTKIELESWVDETKYPDFPEGWVAIGDPSIYGFVSITYFDKVPMYYTEVYNSSKCFETFGLNSETVWTAVMSHYWEEEGEVLEKLDNKYLGILVDNPKKAVIKNTPVSAINNNGFVPCNHLLEKGKTYIIDINGAKRSFGATDIGDGFDFPVGTIGILYPNCFMAFTGIRDEIPVFGVWLSDTQKMLEIFNLTEEEAPTAAISVYELEEPVFKIDNRYINTDKILNENSESPVSNKLLASELKKAKYTAGTGISISTDGVISIALTDAGEVSF